MDKEKYNDMKALEERIEKFSIMKNYVSSMLNSEPFKIKIETSVVGFFSSDPITVYPAGAFSFKDSEDAKYVKDIMQVRLTELKTKFNEY